MTATRDDLELAPHPARSVVWLLGGMAGLSAFAGAALGSMSGEFSIAPLLPVAVFGSLAAWVAVSGRAAQANNKAVNLMTLGRLEAAETLYRRHATAIRLAGYARLLDLHQATIAYRRGELTRALAFADRGIAHRRKLLVRIYDDGHRAMGVGLRALLRASTGDVEGSRRDIEASRDDATAEADAIALVELAEAINLDRLGATAVLREHLRQKKTLLSGWLKPRERALIRALARKLDREKSSIYRVAAPRDPSPVEEPALSDWMEMIVPGSGAFAPPQGSATVAKPRAPAPAIDPAALAAARRVAKPRLFSRVSKVLLLWVLLIMAFVGIWQFFTPDAAAPRPPTPPPVEPASPFWSDWTNVGIVVFVLALFFGRVVLAQVRGLRGARALNAAVRAIALDDPRGPERVAEMAAGPQPGVAANAAHWVAELADRRGDFAAALAAAEAGISRIAKHRLEAATSDWVLPDLWSDRAFAKLLLGRREEAIAEIAIMTERFPSFPYLARATLRIDLVDQLRRGDFAGAADVAAGVQDVPISPRVELLADLARALGTAATPEVERTRIHAELFADAADARWIRLAAPGVIEAFERSSALAEHDAEIEAIAEAEAQADPPLRVERE